MLRISDLHVSIQGEPILRGLNLDIQPGTVHAIMGPNGSGKSTLAQVLAGRPEYEITSGIIEFQGQNLLEWSPAQRAQQGIFLGFQYPVEIPGISNLYFLKAAYNAHRKAKGLSETDAMDFMELVRSRLDDVGLDMDMMYRSVNEGFSGGEKKRNELLHLLLLEPALAVLDETDSGLDIDALQIVARGIQSMRTPDRSIILITHYQRLLNYIPPDHVSVLYQGRIIETGDASLAQALEERGYGWLIEQAEAGSV